RPNPRASTLRANAPYQPAGSGMLSTPARQGAGGAGGAMTRAAASSSGSAGPAFDSTFRRPPPGQAFGPRNPGFIARTQLPGPQVGGKYSVGANAATSFAGRTALDRAFAGRDTDNPLGRILRSTGYPAAAGAVTHP